MECPAEHRIATILTVALLARPHTETIMTARRHVVAVHVLHARALHTQILQADANVIRAPLLERTAVLGLTDAETP